MIQSSDIVYVLSGGSGNTNPAQSLGGDPSSNPILSGVNNLFDDVSEANTTNGYVDYRCFYIFNNSADYTLWNSNVYLDSQTPSASTSQIGFIFSDEVQTLSIIGSVTGGSLTLSYEESPFTFSYDPDLSTWGSNLQTAINTIAALANVTVTAQYIVSTSTTVFTILYTGIAGNRSQPLLTTVTNDLTPTPNIATSRLTSGGPINSIAEVINQATTTPTGVVFSEPDSAEPLAIGNLYPADGFPVWVMRTTPAGTAAIAGDGVNVNCTGTVFQS